MGILSIFKNKAGAASAEIKKVENRDLMQAVVGAAILIAGADGDIETSELDKLEKLIRSNKAFDHFGPEISETINRFKEQLEAGFRVARMNIMREIRDVKNNPGWAEEVMVNAITIAESDGEIEPAEIKVIAEIARELGQNPRDYGIEL